MPSISMILNSLKKRRIKRNPNIPKNTKSNNIELSTKDINNDIVRINKKSQLSNISTINTNNGVVIKIKKNKTKSRKKKPKKRKSSNTEYFNAVNNSNTEYFDAVENTKQPIKRKKTKTKTTEKDIKKQCSQPIETLDLNKEFVKDWKKLVKGNTWDLKIIALRKMLDIKKIQIKNNLQDTIESFKKYPEIIESIIYFDNLVKMANASNMTDNEFVKLFKKELGTISNFMGSYTSNAKDIKKILLQIANCYYVSM